MSESAIGWTLVAADNSTLAVCANCMERDESFDADLFGAAEWAVASRLAKAPAAAGDVLSGQPEGRLPCYRCGKPLDPSLG